MLTITVFGDILKSVQENSEGRREYQKGKQEDNVTPGNRIREIEMFKRN